MKPSHELKVAILTKLGWKNADHYETGFGDGKRLVTRWAAPNGIFYRVLPDIFDNLDDIREATRLLKEAGRDKFMCKLRDIIRRDINAGKDFYWNYINASALQRTEALARTLNINIENEN